MVYNVKEEFYAILKENSQLRNRRMREKIKIIYEDESILVAYKPAGVATQTNKTGEKDMESLLKNYIYKQKKVKAVPYLAIIHRLDQPVEGILVFAKEKVAAKELNRQLQTKGFGKEYKAIVCGKLPEKKGKLKDYVIKDAKENRAYICPKTREGAKEAVLYYELLEERQDRINLVHICLETGRFHQIRVQMANIGCPLWGDAKYNPMVEKSGRWEQIALCAYRLQFRHPRTGRLMEFEIEPKGEAFRERALDKE